MEKPKSWRFPSDDFPFELGGLFRFQADDFRGKIARKTNSRPSTPPTCLWKKILSYWYFWGTLGYVILGGLLEWGNILPANLHIYVYRQKVQEKSCRVYMGWVGD